MQTISLQMCKTMRRDRLQCAALQEDVEDIQREVEVLNLISDHENIAELIDSYEDPQHVHLVCF